MRLRTTMVLGLALTGCVTFHEGAVPGAPTSASFVDAAGTSVRYVDENAEAARTVVLLHGFGATLDEWREVVPRLTEARFRVIALDLRGFGWSGRSAQSDYSIDAQAELVLDVLRQRGVEKFTIVGHSWGSAVALQVAVSKPEAVERVVLFNGMVFDDQQPTLFDWARLPVLGELIFGLFYQQRTDEKMALAFYDAERFVTQAAVDRVEASQALPGATAAALATIRAIDLSKLETKYGTIDKPTLLIWGREDHITPLAGGERLRNQLTRAKLVVLPQCGHLPMIELPTRSTSELLSFLAEDDQ